MGNFFSSIGSSIKNIASNVWNSVSSAFTSSPQQLTGAASMAFPVGAGMTPTQTAKANQVISNGGSSPVNNTNPYNITYGNTGAPMTSIYAGGAAPSGGGGSVSFPAGVGSGPGQNMTQLPVSMRSGTTTGNYKSPSYDPYAAGGNTLMSQMSSPASSTVQVSNIATPSAVTPQAPSATNYYGDNLAKNIAAGANPITGLFDKEGMTTDANGNPVKKEGGDEKKTESTFEEEARKYFNDTYNDPRAKTDREGDYNRALERSGEMQARQQMQATQNAINAVTTKMNTDLLNHRAMIAAEGGTETGFGGRQAAITREATVKLLPLQAQLAIDQGNFEGARERTNTLFKMYSEEADASTKRWFDQREAIYELATSSQKRKLDEAAKDKDFLRQTVSDSSKQQEELAMALLESGSRAGYKAATELRPPTNVNAKDFDKEFAKYRADLARVVAQYGGSLKAAAPANNQMTDNERALMTQFTSQPIVKEFNQILAQKGTIDAYIKNGTGGPSDLATIFSFMKGLDPESVVRETEYANAAKSGNIFQGVFAKFNGYFKEKGGILPASVKQEFQNLVNQRLSVKQDQYENLKSQIEGIADRQGLDKRNVVIDYAAGGVKDAPAGSSADPLGIL